MLIVENYPGNSVNNVQLHFRVIPFLIFFFKEGKKEVAS